MIANEAWHMTVASQYPCEYSDGQHMGLLQRSYGVDVGDVRCGYLVAHVFYSTGPMSYMITRWAPNFHIKCQCALDMIMEHDRLSTDGCPALPIEILFKTWMNHLDH